MVTDQDRLAQRDLIGDRIDDGPCEMRVLGALVAVVFEPLGTLFGTADQGRVFVSDFAAQLNQQVFAGGSPGRGHEQLLFRCPDETGSADTIIGCLVEAAGGIQPQFVVFWRIRSSHGHKVSFVVWAAASSHFQTAWGAHWRAQFAAFLVFTGIPTIHWPDRPRPMSRQSDESI